MGGGGGNCPPRPGFGRIEGAAGQWRVAALLFAITALNSYFRPYLFLKVAIIKFFVMLKKSFQIYFISTCSLLKYYIKIRC
jgi:hypothetical protein